MNQLRCNPYRITGAAVGVTIVLAVIPMFFVPGTNTDQAQLSRLVQTMKDMQAQCDDPELVGLLEYTSQTYDTVSRFNVRILPMEWFGAAGMNWPIVPGMTLDRWCWGTLDDRTLIGLMLHEAMHDYYPGFGHGHMDHLVPVNANKNKYNELCR